MQRKLLWIVIFVLLLTGCVQTNAKHVEINDELRKDAIELVKIIEEKYSSKSELIGSEGITPYEFVDKHDPLSESSYLTSDEKRFVMKVVDLHLNYLGYIYNKDLTQKDEYVELLSEIKSILQIE